VRVRVGVRLCLLSDFVCKLMFPRSACDILKSNYNFVMVFYFYYLADSVNVGMQTLACCKEVQGAPHCAPDPPAPHHGKLMQLWLWHTYNPRRADLANWK